MPDPASVAPTSRVHPRTRRLPVVLAATSASAALLGLAAPALASAGVPAAPAALPQILTTNSISGHVTFPSGSSAATDGFVTVTGADGPHTFTVDALGNYVAGNLPLGSYTVSFDRVAGPAGAAAQFYNGVDESAGAASATPVQVGALLPTLNINATLRAGGHITGRLVGPVIQPLTCQVEAFTADGSLVARSATSASGDGSFDIGGLTTGSYYLEALPVNGAGCSIPRYRGADASMLPTGPGTPTAVTQGGSTDVGLMIYGSPAVGPTPTPIPTPIPAPIADPLPHFTVTRDAKVAGQVVVGRTVRVKPAGLVPTASTVTFQWLLDGHRIKGATQRTFKVVGADAGRKLSVRVTYRRSGVPTFVNVTKVGRAHRPHG